MANDTETLSSSVRAQWTSSDVEDSSDEESPISLTNEDISDIDIAVDDELIPVHGEDIDNEEWIEPLVTFTCFPKLPPELRLKIWKHACFIPRALDIYCGFPRRYGQCDQEYEQSLYDLFSSSQLAFRSEIGAKPPAILHTSSEARKEGLKHYELGFGETTKERVLGQVLTLESPPQIYVNWECDVICPIEDPTTLDADAESGERLGVWLNTITTWHNIRHLAIHSLSKYVAPELRSLLRKLSLHELTLYCEPEELRRNRLGVGA